MSKKIRIDSEFPFKAQFDGIQIKAVSLDKSELGHIAQASANKLRDLLPKGFDFDANYDVLGVAFNAYTPNLGNKNGHMISGSKGIDIAPFFRGKYINVEHDRFDIIGCITDYGFSTFPDDTPITEEEARALADEGKIFNVVLSGIIWRTVNPEFADLIEDAGDISSDKFGLVSASWEVAFKDFNVAKGSKYLSSCEIIDDKQECGKLKKKLQVFGGKGCDDEGTPLYLNLIGDTILSLGVGLTANPAAEVRGIVTSETQIEASATEPDNAPDQKKSGKNETENVINQEASINDMKKITKIEEITDEALKSISASAITEFLADKIAESSVEWKKKIDEKENIGSSLEAQIKTLQAQLDELKNTKDASEKELLDLRNQISAKEMEEAFQIRMTSINDKFELNDEESALIVAEVKACANDEEFTKWLEKFSVLAKEKSKEFIAARAAEMEELKKNAVRLKASEDDEAAKAAAAQAEADKAAAEKAAADKAAADAAAAAVAAASAKSSDIPNGGSATTPSLKERMSAAFGGDNIKITVK